MLGWMLFFQERGGLESFTHEALALKYHLDNEFELVFVVSHSTVSRFVTQAFNCSINMLGKPNTAFAVFSP